MNVDKMLILTELLWAMPRKYINIRMFQKHFSKYLKEKLENFLDYRDIYQGDINAFTKAVRFWLNLEYCRLFRIT